MGRTFPWEPVVRESITLCPPAAMPTPWTACTVWPEKVRQEVGAWGSLQAGPGSGPWGEAGMGGASGWVPNLSSSPDRGSEEAVLRCNHGVQSRDVGHRGPGRTLAWGGTLRQHLGVGALEGSRH